MNYSREVDALYCKRNQNQISPCSVCQKRLEVVVPPCPYRKRLKWTGYFTVVSLILIDLPHYICL